MRINYPINNIIIYDLSEVFSNMIKHNCGNNIDITFINKKNDLHKINLKNYETKKYEEYIIKPSKSNCKIKDILEH